MKPPFHFFFFYLIAVAFLAGAGIGQSVLGQPTRDYDERIKKRSQEIQRLLAEKKGAISKIEIFRKREWRVLEILKVINDSIISNKKKLEITIDGIKQLQMSIRLTNKKIRQLNAEITADKEEISRQLNALLYLGRVRNMTAFIGRNSFENYFRNQKLLQHSTQLDMVLLDRLNLNLEDLQIQKMKRQQQWTELLTLKKIEEEQKELLRFELQQQVTYLLHLREDRESRLRFLSEVESELERLNDMIYSLEVERETQRKVEQFQGFLKLKQRLPPPVKGILVHRFKQQGSIFYTLYRRGVLIETSKNEEVRSILPGKVVWVGPFRGYHNLVIVDHGKGSLSVYGNLDEIYAIGDEIIDQGYPIGTVAYNDQESRYLFYFETRLNKRAVDPVQWLDNPDWR